MSMPSFETGDWVHLDGREVFQAWFILPLLLHPVEKCSAPWFPGRVKQFSPGSLLSKFRCWVIEWGVPIDISGAYPSSRSPNSGCFDLGWRQKERKSFPVYSFWYLLALLGGTEPLITMQYISPWDHPHPEQTLIPYNFNFPAETKRIGFRTRWQTSEKSNLVVYLRYCHCISTTR